MSQRRIAYLGDTTLPGPASYLVGIMTHFGLPHVYVPSREPPSEAALGDSVGLYVLSDYPAGNFPPDAMRRMCERVRDGAGLLMLGGWESYHGLQGGYDTTPLAEHLPVKVIPQDDRRNWAQLILVRAVCDHEILGELPFDEPPGIGGYNEFLARSGSTVVLEGERYRIVCSSDRAEFTPQDRFPLLVVGEGNRGRAGAGRRACLATDVAPHWIGGWVDWGTSRLTVSFGDDFIEVGNHYAEFFRNLLVWCLGKDES
jgi:uncharacterized membrane protein